MFQQEDLSYGGKVEGPSRGSKPVASIPLWPLHHLQVSALVSLNDRLEAERNPFPPKVLLSWCLSHNTEGREELTW